MQRDGKKMTLEENDEDEHRRHGGVYPQCFYDKAGHEVSTGIYPHKCHMDRPDTAPEVFTRANDLDG